MNLSKRLQAVADLVDGKNIIDVGCDHGYLSIYLKQKGINCLATDISLECIKKAKDNFKKYQVNIDAKVTDGINGIDINKFDTIILSGMGTHTILKILTNKELTNSLIISSNNNIELLRREITKLEYYIDDEIYLKESNQRYIIIKFKKGYKEYTDFDYVVGPILKFNHEYIKDYINACKDIINKIKDNDNSKNKYYQDLINKLKQLS